MTPSQDHPADLSAVELALSAAIGDTKQKDRAVIVGLTNGAQLSRRESRLVTGEADTYVEVYLAHHFLRLAKAVPVLGDAVKAFLSDSEQVGDGTQVERDLSTFGQAAAEELAQIMRDGVDGFDRAEAAKHRTSLMALQELIRTTITNLDHRARGNGRPRREFP